MSAILKDVRIGDCRLILGDCLQVMPLLGEFDAVVTDPPYGIKRFKKGFGTTRFNSERAAKEGLKWDNKPKSFLQI